MRAIRQLDKDIQYRIVYEVQKETEKQIVDITRKNFKLFCCALNIKKGFGQKRLNEVLAAVQWLSEESCKDEIFWHHVDNLLVDKMGLQFEKEEGGPGTA